MEIEVNKVLDAKGLACPMPIIRTKKMMTELTAGQVLEIQATDKGSTADLQAWATKTGHNYIGTVEESGVLKHYLRKSTPEEEKEVSKYSHVTELKDLKEKLDKGEEITVLDVREPAEFAFGHIAEAKHIPMGALEARLDELNKGDEIYVICRTGNRSDFAAQTLTQNGFNKVTNVVPGMAEWDGPSVKDN
jgi:rhodanese-related sulfurtransferase